jgi:hypothetical protein
MIQLQINPIVLKTLENQYPTPKNSASRQLNKYIKILTEQLTNSILYGRNAWMQAHNLYSISTSRQRHKGSQIGNEKIRLQNWLEENNLQLFTVVQIGTNLTKKLSVIKLTELVSVVHTDTHVKTHDELETEELHELLFQQVLSNQELFDKEYPNLNNMTDEEVKSIYDIVPIDIISLSNYIAWLKFESKYISEKNKEMYLLQADKILRIAQFSNGIYLQKKKASDFGRIYYSGVSVQNVNKELRRAMLGHCYEYDLRSSVFSCKMGFARQCYESLNLSEPFEKVFSSSLLFLEDKKDFFMTVRHYTFTEDSSLDREMQDKLLKQAVTAIGFGARKGTHGWKLNGRDWKNPALVDIFKNNVERERFINCFAVKNFLHEQNLLDRYIFNLVKKQDYAFLKSDLVRTQSGSLSKSKVIAYIYQHFETDVMDIVEREIVSRGNTVLARIHDAIIVKRRLGESKFEIEDVIQRETQNKYWHLTMKEIEPFNRPYCLDRDEIEAHKKRIVEEERKAKEFSARTFIFSVEDNESLFY